MTQGVDGAAVPLHRDRDGASPAVDAVIVAYESGATIDACVSALLQVPGPIHVTVVDHGSDGAGRRAEQLGATVVRDSNNPGFGAGQNRGRGVTTAPFVLMCNPDAVIAPDAIAAGVALMADQPDLGALQGTIRERDRDLTQRSSWQSVGAMHLWARILRVGPFLRTGPLRRTAARLRLTPQAPVSLHDVEALAAIVLLARRDALDEVGGFDPGYFMYWEDLDLSKRLRRAGWRLRVTPELWAVHIGGASHTDPFQRERQWWRGCMRYAALWYGKVDWVAAVAAASVQCLTMSIGRPSMARALWQDLITSPRGLRRGCSETPTLVRRGTP